MERPLYSYCTLLIKLFDSAVKTRHLREECDILRGTGMTVGTNRPVTIDLTSNHRDKIKTDLILVLNIKTLPRKIKDPSSEYNFLFEIRYQFFLFKSYSDTISIFNFNLRSILLLVVFFSIFFHYLTLNL